MISVRNSFLTLCFLLLAATVLAQDGTASLRGQVTDPTGAVIPGANVSLSVAGSKNLSTVSDKQGNYEFKTLSAGNYSVKAQAKGFAIFKTDGLAIAEGERKRFDINLEVAATEQSVKVEETTEQVNVSPDNNAGATVLKGKDLDILSDDPDELQADLQALAGPSVGPNGGEIYIDGFTNGELPPKNAIREIRINQNPFSAQFDRLGFGRVEIFTKPGMNQFHGQLQFMDNDSIFNSIAKFGPSKIPSYQTEQYSGNVSGPVNKKASFSFNFERRNINDISLINAYPYSSDPKKIFTEALAKPQRRTNFSPRLDVQLSQNNTLTSRYQYMENSTENNGVGGFTLATRATNSNSNEHMLQLSDSQIIGANIVNETRLQVLRDRSQVSPDGNCSNYSSSDPVPCTAFAVSVPGAFSSGLSTSGAQETHSVSIDLQNYTSVMHGNHFFRFGGRLRSTDDINNQFSGANGSFSYTTLASYSLTPQTLTSGTLADAQQIVATGGGASQYSVTTCANGGIGCSVVSNTYVDAGLYAEDDWKIRPNLTLSTGLRFETQNDLGDHKDLAPRLGLAWGINKVKGVPTTVLRAGFGLFYDRVSQGNWLNTLRYNGQQNSRSEAAYTVTCANNTTSSPTNGIPCVADPNSPTGLLGYSSFNAMGAAAVTSIYEYAPNMHAPYTVQSAFTIEQQVTSNAKITINYMQAQGNHQRDMVDLTTPDPTTGTRPLPVLVSGTTNITNTNLYQYQTEGIFKMRMLMMNGQAKVNTRLSLFGFLGFSRVHSDNGSGIASNSSDLRQDWGRAGWMPPIMSMIFGSVQGPWGLRLNPMISMQSANYYNITLNHDLNGDGSYNDRPTYATLGESACASGQTTACYIDTKYGRLNPNPTISGTEKFIPYNLGKGHGQFMFNMRLAKTFGIGPKLKKSTTSGNYGGQGGGGGHRGPGGGAIGAMFAPSPVDRKYSATISINARNLFNTVNLGTPNGVIGSSTFGQSYSLAGGWGATTAANRKIEMQVQFSF